MADGGTIDIRSRYYPMGALILAGSLGVVLMSAYREDGAEVGEVIATGVVLGLPVLGLCVRLVRVRLFEQNRKLTIRNVFWTRTVDWAEVRRVKTKDGGGSSADSGFLLEFRFVATGAQELLVGRVQSLAGDEVVLELTTSEGKQDADHLTVSVADIISVVRDSAFLRMLESACR